MSAPSKTSILLAHKVLIIIATIGTASAATVSGLVYAPGSPGFPYLSPTYQAQRAPFQIINATDASLYEVWYVPGSTILVLILSANNPETHFFGVLTSGANTPTGNFSTHVSISKERTYLAIPANACPSANQIPAVGFTVTAAVIADSPAIGGFSFQYACQANPSLATLTLGNPHIIVAGLVPWSFPVGPVVGKEALTMDSYGFNSGTNAVLYIRNTGTVNATLVSYYVNDSGGDQYFRNDWSTGPNLQTAPISLNAVAVTFILIGTSGTGTCGTSCSLSGSPFTFQLGYSYKVVVITARNDKFPFTISR